MLNPTILLKQGMHHITDHAPAILTAFGAVGVVGTAVLTGKATFEAAEKITEEEFVQKQEHGFDFEGLSKTEKVKLVWVCYLPAAATGTLSVAAIIMSHRISSKRAAVLAAAYALNQDKLEEYQDKVKEKLGVKKEKDIRDEIAQDQVGLIADGGFEFANPIAGKVWIMEAYTGRPFLGTVEEVKRAVNEINHEINGAGAVRMSDFYDAINGVDAVKDPRNHHVKLPHVSLSDHFGWTRNNLLELDWTTTTSPDGNLAVHVFDYVNHPVMDPEREASFR